MPRVYSIDKIASFVGSERISSFHYDMFHGVAERRGAATLEDKYPWAGRGADLPLWISRPGTFIPELCAPVHNFIVGERIVEQLRGLPGIEFLPVQFERLFEVEYEKGDFSWYRTGKAPEDPVKFARKAKDERVKFEPIPPFYEVLTHRHQDIVDDFAEVQLVHFETSSPDFAEQADVRLSEEMIRQYPILFQIGFRIVSEEVYSIFEPHLDRDFFFVSAVDF
jgi:hypothetical protein